MESMKFVRNEAISMVDIDFFLNEEELNVKQEDDRIAEVIRGKSYERTKQKINEFISRCEQTLAGLQERVNQTDSEFNSLVSSANSERPGSPPIKMFVDNSDANSVNKYNAKVQRYNNQVELHQRIVDQANRAKERYEDAVAKYDEKKAELEEQIRERLEELKPALDQDILTLLGKLQQVAYDNIRNKNNQFAGFLLSYLTKKVYIFLYDYIDSTTEQRAATDIFSKLNDEFDFIITNSGDVIKDNLKKTVEYLFGCYHSNFELLSNIQGNLNKMPYEKCSETKPEVETLLQLPIETNFDYKQIIDPDELNKVEEKVKERKESFEKNVTDLDNLFTRISAIFENIYDLKNNSDIQSDKMIENKLNLFDPFSKDLFFILGFFDDEDQDRYMRMHKDWIRNILTDLQNNIDMELSVLLNKTKQTELLTLSAKELLTTNDAIQFFSNKEKLTQKKNQYIEAIDTLNKILEDISKLPKQKSIEFTKKMSLWLYLSILPLGNIGVIFPIMTLVSKYLPALKSKNSVFIELKNNFAKKFSTFSYLHIFLVIISAIFSFVLLEYQIIFVIVAATYLISFVVLFLKANQLKKLK